MVMKKTGLFLALIVAALFLAACQANNIRDTQSGTVKPSFSSELTDINVK